MLCCAITEVCSILSNPVEKHAKNLPILSLLSCQNITYIPVFGYFLTMTMVYDDVDRLLIMTDYCNAPRAPTRNYGYCTLRVYQIGF